jgi:hypothetical protein
MLKIFDKTTNSIYGDLKPQKAEEMFKDLVSKRISVLNKHFGENTYNSGLLIISEAINEIYIESMSKTIKIKFYGRPAGRLAEEITELTKIRDKTLDKYLEIYQGWWNNAKK